jgi:HEAT repeat protein
MLVRERKSGSGPIQEEERAIRDRKALILLGIGVTAGFVPYGSYGWAAFTILSKDHSSPIVVDVTNRLSNDTDPLATRALVNAATNKNWKVRAVALDALARRENPELLDGVLPHLSDKKHAVK